MRSVVRAASAVLIPLRCVERSSMVGGFLRASALFQLPPLYGDHLSRLSSRGRFSKVPHLHRTYHGSACADADLVAFLGSHPAVDLYDLLDLEPVALQRAELRLVHDVRSPRRSDPERLYPPRALRRFHCFLLDPVPGFPHRAFHRSSFHFNRNSRCRQPLGANSACGCVCCAGSFWTFAAGSGNRLAQAAAFAHIVLIAVPMVSPAGGDFLNQRSGHSAEPLQFGRASCDAFGAVSLDYELLCPARGLGRERPGLASMGLFRSAD